MIRPPPSSTRTPTLFPYPTLCRSPAQRAFFPRPGGRCAVGAPLDLDKGDGAAAPRDQVYLSPRAAHPLPQYAIALEAEPPCGEHFGPASSRFATGAIGQFFLSFSSSARS